MKYREQSSGLEQIRDINCIVNGEICTLTWMWPRGVNSVYIHRTCEGQEVNIENITHDNSKLYTKDEYMEFNGFHERVSGVGRYVYSIYPFIKEDGEMILINQNSESSVIVCTGKVCIFYSIKEKRKLFSGRKSIVITVSPETPLNREVLCYVKKGGSHPSGINDGVMFPFMQDFRAGNNTMPEIEVNKDEYIMVFLSDTGIYSELYELIRR